VGSLLQFTERMGRFATVQTGTFHQWFPASDEHIPVTCPVLVTLLLWHLTIAAMLYGLLQHCNLFTSAYALLAVPCKPFPATLLFCILPCPACVLAPWFLLSAVVTYYMEPGSSAVGVRLLLAICACWTFLPAIYGRCCSGRRCAFVHLPVELFSISILHVV
jgi:hypothetical protein